MQLQTMQILALALGAMAAGALIVVLLRGDYWMKQRCSLDRGYTMLRDKLRERDAEREEELQQAHCRAAYWQRRNDELREQNGALEVSLDAAAQQLEALRRTLTRSDELRREAVTASQTSQKRLSLLECLLPLSLRMPRNDADALLAELPADLAELSDEELGEISERYTP